MMISGFIRCLVCKKMHTVIEPIMTCQCGTVIRTYEYFSSVPNKDAKNLPL